MIIDDCGAEDVFDDNNIRDYDDDDDDYGSNEIVLCN